MSDSIGEWAAPAGLKAVQLGIVAGFFTCLAYPLLVFVPLPTLATTTLAACFGPALAVASFGLRRLLNWETPLVSSALGALLNGLGGALFAAMALVQMAVGYSAGSEKVSVHVTAIWLGLDVGCLHWFGNNLFRAGHAAPSPLRQSVCLFRIGHCHRSAGAQSLHVSHAACECGPSGRRPRHRYLVFRGYNPDVAFSPLGTDIVPLYNVMPGRRLLASYGIAHSLPQHCRR